MIKKSYSSSIIAWFTANPVAANLLMILVIMLGVLESGQLRKEAFPSMDPRSLTISVSYDSGSAKQSEEGLAIKIEEQLEDVIGIKRITSTSKRKWMPYRLSPPMPKTRLLRKPNGKSIHCGCNSTVIPTGIACNNLPIT